MQKNKLKLIIFIQFITIYCLCLYCYFNRAENTASSEILDRETSKWLEKKWHLSIDQYRRLALKYDLPIENANMYGLIMGTRRSENLNILITGFECTKYRLDGVARMLQMWHEYLPNVRISILSRENCEFFEILPKKLFQKVLIADTELQLDEILFKESLNLNFFDHAIDLGQIEEINHKRFLTIWSKMRPERASAYSLESIHKNYSGRQLVDKILSIVKGSEDTNKIVLAGDELKSLSESLLSINCYLNSCLIVKK